MEIADLVIKIGTFCVAVFILWVVFKGIKLILKIFGTVLLFSILLWLIPATREVLYSIFPFLN